MQGVSIFASYLPGSIYVNVAISTLIELVPYFTTGMLTERFGRRSLMILTLGQAGVGCILFSSLQYLGADPLLISFIAFASKLGVTLSFSVIYVYSVELFPTDVKGKGMGFVNIWARVGGILAPPIADLSTIAAGLIFCAFAVLGACVSCLLPETKGRPVAASLDSAIVAASAEQDGESSIAMPPLAPRGGTAEEYYGRVRATNGAFRAADHCGLMPAQPTDNPSSRRLGKAEQDHQLLLQDDDSLRQQQSSLHSMHVRTVA
jgi:MFS family permease